MSERESLKPNAITSRVGSEILFRPHSTSLIKLRSIPNCSAMASCVRLRDCLSSLSRLPNLLLISRGREKLWFTASCPFAFEGIPTEERFITDLGPVYVLVRCPFELQSFEKVREDSLGQGRATSTFAFRDPTCLQINQ